MAKFDFKQMSQVILDAVGGVNNITNVNHCATRLRLKLKDTAVVDKAAIKALDGVFGVEVAGQEIQVIVGQIIEDLFFAFEALTGMKGGVVDENLDPELKGKKSVLGTFVSFLQLMAGIMSPVIPTLIIAGFFSLILTLGSFVGMDSTTTTYQMLYNISQAPF
ncbi:MAG: PTS transporter subunit EIIB, partial [Erysipelotrichaceae bacterium]|nr:PTS transporter subunit EIIB [Erysipelotrichaceae bacterium]